MGHEVRLLGPWELRIGHGAVSVPGMRLRVLLTSLVLSANQTVDVDTLAEQLWPEQLPERPRQSLHTYVGRLRKLLGSDMIHTQPGVGYQLSIPPDAVDIHRFRDLLRRASEAGTTDEELALLRLARALWRGVPFADLYSTWLDREVAPQLTEEWFAATGRRIELELAAGPPEPLIAELRHLTDRYPTRELLWRHLIAALHRAGRRAEALEAFRRARTILRDELGIEPSEPLAALQREILIDGSTPPVLRQLPHDLPRFIGRGEELAALDAMLTGAAPAGPVIVAIGGAPGIGKTTLALHWAHRVARHFPDAQLYIDLRGYGLDDPLTPEAAAETLLLALGFDRALIPSEMDARSALLRSRLAEQRTLLVLDNARDSEQVRPLLPGSAALVIVTSRNQLRGLSIRDGAFRVTLRPLSQWKSVELLTDRSGATAEPATALAELCDRLPLALAIAADRVRRTGSLAQVVAELADEHTRLEFLDSWGDSPASSLRAVLSWSHRALEPAAAAMLRSLGHHPAKEIEVATAAALADVSVTRARVLLDHLASAHLAVQRRPDVYELPCLIRLYANELS